MSSHTGKLDHSHIPTEYVGQTRTFFLLSSKHSLLKYDLVHQAAVMWGSDESRAGCFAILVKTDLSTMETNLSGPCHQGGADGVIDRKGCHILDGWHESWSKSGWCVRDIWSYSCYRKEKGFPASSDGKDSTYNEGDLGLIPGLGRSPGGGHGNPFQYSCLENPHGQRTLGGVIVHGVARAGHD